MIDLRQVLHNHDGIRSSYLLRMGFNLAEKLGSWMGIFVAGDMDWWNFDDSNYEFLLVCLYVFVCFFVIISNS
jgi:hypothetical protein